MQNNEDLSQDNNKTICKGTKDLKIEGKQREIREQKIEYKTQTRNERKYMYRSCTIIENKILAVRSHNKPGVMREKEKDKNRRLRVRL